MNMLKYLKLEFKMTMRDPALLFFVILFPTMLLVFFTSTLGSGKTDLGGLKYVDWYLPSVFMYAIISSSLPGFAQIVHQYKTENIYTVYKNKGISVGMYLIVQIIVQIFIVLVSVTLALLVAKFGFDAQLTDIQHLFILYGQIIVSCCILYLAGASIGLLFKTSGATSAVATVVMFIIYFLSGMMIPLLQFNDTLRGGATKLITTAMISDFSYTLNGSYLVSHITNNEIHYFIPDWWLIPLWAAGIGCLFLICIKRKVSGKR